MSTMASFPFADDAVAMVSGAGSGIGRAAAIELARSGIRVAVGDLDEAGGQQTVEDIRGAGGTAEFQRVDVTDEDAVDGWVQGAVARWGRLDLQFNNAGINGPTEKLEAYTALDFERVIRTNLISVALCMRCAIPHMKERGGAIVNTGSTASVTGYATLSGYTAAKHGVLGLTRSVALEYAEIPIRVNCVCPGPTSTPLMHGIEESLNPEDPESVRKQFAATTALKRYASPGEIAQIVAFLLSDAAGYVTGAAFSVDAGVTAGFG
jgi:NAD(P)-dependent dehydrogenase (short-subunit alcohol dehydrogenase family)